MFAIERKENKEKIGSVRWDELMSDEISGSLVIDSTRVISVRTYLNDDEDGCDQIDQQHGVEETTHPCAL